LLQLTDGVFAYLRAAGVVDLALVCVSQLLDEARLGSDADGESSDQEEGIVTIALPIIVSDLRVAFPHLVCLTDYPKLVSNVFTVHLGAKSNA
jgi:hypothetical protein